MIYGYNDNAGALALANKKKDFFKAQNRIAYLMFLLLVCELLASMALMIVEWRDPLLFENARLKETANALIYVFYMLTPSLVYLAVRKKDVHAKHEKPKKPHTFALFLFGLGVVYVGQLASFLMAVIFADAGIDLYSSLEQSVSADPVLMIIEIVEVAFLPAVLEELLARHIILTELQKYGRSFAVMVSALLFSLMHMNPIQMPFAFIAGLAMAYTTVATGSVIPSFFLHFINNTLSVVLTFLPEFTNEKTAFIADAVITVVILAAGAAAGIYLLKKREKEEETVNETPAAEAMPEPAPETAPAETESGGEENEEAPPESEAADETENRPTAEEKAAAINVIDGKVTKNLSPTMTAYIIAALFCTLLTFFILWGSSVTDLI